MDIWQMKDEFGKDLEGSGRGLIEDLPRHFSGGTEQNKNKKLS
jgi:hypothetical protein